MNSDNRSDLEALAEVEDKKNEYWPRIIDSITWGIVIVLVAYWLLFT